MKYLENNKIKNEVIEILIGELENHESDVIYACDLVYVLLDKFGKKGSITYNAHKAKRWILSNFDDLEEIVDNLESRGLKLPNAFVETEKFMVVIYSEVADYLLAQCKIIDDNKYNKITLDANTIKLIAEELIAQLD